MLNQPPTDPTSVTIPDTVQFGAEYDITWSPSEDPDGDTLTYTVEQQLDTGSWVQLATGVSGTAYTATAPTTGTQFRARVKATDSYGNESGYGVSGYAVINYNNPPVISGEDEDIGPQVSPVTYAYTVDDVDESQTLTVTEALVTGSQVTVLRSFAADRQQEYTADTSAVWLPLAASAHTLRITVEDEVGGSATRNITFTRQINRLEALRAVTTSTALTQCTVRLYPETQPPGATVHCEVSNNPFDATPVWEDISSELGVAHVFANTTVEVPGFAMRFYVQKAEGSTEQVEITQSVISFL